MAQPGLLEWANSVRFTMANDPGRQFFQNQIQTHGFFFLNDYLDNILAGAKQDPLIELVKTPGRKKAVAGKGKAVAAISKLKNVVNLSLEQDRRHRMPTFVNESPVPDIHKEDLRPEMAAYSFPPVATLLLEQEEVHQEPPLNSDIDSLTPTHSEQNELSVIAEDNESPERNYVSIHASDAFNDDMTQAMNLPTSSPTNIFPPFCSQQPPQYGSKTLQNSIPVPRPSHPSRSHSPSGGAVSNAHLPHKSSSGNFTALPPETLPWRPHSAPQNDAMNAPHATLPLPTLDSTLTLQDIEVPVRDASQISPKGLTHKLSVPLFPSLPAPMPLRKSMRAARDPSMGVGPTVMGAATPGAVGGKRTSWLMKAREVKAMEIPMRKTSSIDRGAVTGMAPPVPGMANGVKRKSGDMLGTPEIGVEDDERRHKVAKHVECDVAPFKPTSCGSSKGKEKEKERNPPNRNQQQELSPQAPPIPQPHYSDEQEGMLDRFKRTVEGLGARVGKSMGKSLGGAAAANALADAKAAAEARVTERNNKEEEMAMSMGNSAVSPPPVIVPPVPAPVSTSTLKENMMVEPPSRLVSSEPPMPAERRLSLSDLVTAHGGGCSTEGKDTEPGQVAQHAPDGTSADSRTSHRKGISVTRESTTTTPPESPLPIGTNSFVLPSGPVFNRPPPVFVPPVSAPSAPVNQTVHKAESTRNFALNLPASGTFSVPATMSLGLVPLSAQSTLESVVSDALFDNHDDVPAWMPATQDTDYSSGFGSQSQQFSQPHGRMNELDEDDSWPMDEKLFGGAQWAFGTGISKEDSLTWSTLPTDSQRADAGPMRREQVDRERKETEVCQTSRVIPGTFDMEVDDEYEGGDDLRVGDSGFDEMDIEPGKATVSLVESKPTRSQSRLSLASSTSSQSHRGFLGHASKLVSSVLGTSKKGKPEVKSLQLAAVAAKKHQEDKDRKAARLKEMENRRQLALQRKVGEEKARALEQERKIKEDGERRKREREEHTDKRPLKGAGSKKEEDSTKKRKVVVETEKKLASKTSQSSLNTSNAVKATAKPALKQPASLSSSAPSNASLQTIVSSTSTVKATGTGSSKATTTAAKGKGKAPVPDDDISQPSRIVQTQMAARAKAQLKAAKDQQAGEPISESIELPDINSEYSDSDDDDRPRTFDPPGWAQSPELRQALEIQSTINPDEIFGAIRPLRMEELFRTRTSRFRARTSSANWTGTDRLTVEEQREYARRMGYR